MEDNYDQEFDRLFARDLKTAGQNAAPDPEEWPALSSRLDATGKRRPWPLLLPWLLLSALAVSNGWMLVHWWSMNETVADLQRQSVAIPQPVAVQPVHRATVVYDTIYRTVVVTRRVKEERISSSNEPPQNGKLQVMDKASLAPSASGVQTIATNQFLENKGATLASGSQKLPDSPPVAPQDMTENQSADITRSRQESTTSDTTAQAKNATTSGHIQPDRIASPSSDSTARQLVTRSQLDSLLAPRPATEPTTQPHHEPLHWHIGIGAGFAVPVGSEEISFSRPFSFSLTGEWMLSRHWAIVPGLMYAGHSFKVEEAHDPRLLINAPVPPTQDFRFRSIEGSMSHAIASLALHYRFRPDQIWSWYLGAGYAARFTFAGKAEYEFHKKGTGEEYQYEITSDIPARSLLGEIRGGLEFVLRPRWTLFGTTGGVFDLGPGQRTFPMVTGQLGVKWQVN